MIFLDTSYIIALIIKNDPYYHISEKIEHYLNKEAKITNITVLVEVLNSVNSYNFHGNINDLIRYFFDMDIFDFLTKDDYKGACVLFRYYGGSINFADCTILQSMQNHEITRIASFDKDFDKVKGIQRIGKI